MIRLHCDCGTEIFFDNSHCAVCGKVLGFDPTTQQVLSLQSDTDNTWFSATTGQHYKLCLLRPDLGCNWIVPVHDNEQQCQSCRLTRTIPTLTIPRNLTRWLKLEQTKRRALYMLLRLDLPPDLSEIKSSTLPKSTSQYPALHFDFLEDQRSNPQVALDFVYSGHSAGVITINAAEADDSFRAANREMMNEIYRTLLGHFRHELGHYYGLLLMNDETLDEFRQLFGDEQQDYTAALKHYYNEGAGDDWREHYISAYASSHPQEDWAETWAHYLHIRDTLETAVAYKLIDGDAGGATFSHSLTEWGRLTVVLNALNRSMGVDDAYPFIITPVIGQKLEFIDRLVKVWRMTDHNVVRQ
jgi:hypothetical protein